MILAIIILAALAAQSKAASNASLPSFEVASIKPNSSGTSNISMHVAPGGGDLPRGILR
jgi:predicted S18 family serine protease